MPLPPVVLGFHGCDRSLGESVLAGKNELRPSTNKWDWLGTGIYFWENSARRALEWAQYAKENPAVCRARIKEPFVLGAVIDLGHCLDFLEAESIRMVERAYEGFLEVFESSGEQPPQNLGGDQDKVLRQLDCAVINYVHLSRANKGEKPFDSVPLHLLRVNPFIPTQASASKATFRFVSGTRLG